MPGIISQLKSVVQFICGHVGGVAETQKNFPGVSHAVIGGIFFVCRRRHMWRLFIIQQGEERKNGEGSSQASGRGTSPSPSAIRWKMKIPLT
jgi:hypothetical protein